MTSQQNLITVRGYIISLPRQGGKDDAKVAVQTENGTEYLIMPRGMGMDLVEHINAGVEVTGTLQEVEEQKILSVRQYKMQDEYDDK